MRKPRPHDSHVQLQRLERKHQHLKSRVRELDCRVFLTANEERERMALKKEKLATKDQIVGLRNSMV